MERFDAIVVGAGPAGSVTALRLARGGARVLLADKKRSRATRPAAAASPAAPVRELPCDVSPVVEDVVHRFELRVGYRNRFERRSDAPLVLMTRRRRLDAFLAEQAAAAGVDFRDGVTADRFTVGPDGAEVAIGGARAAAPVLVGADGANGVVARTLGLCGGIEYGIALEGTVRSRQGSVDSPRSKSVSFRAATAGSSRSPTTRTTASAAGRARGRASASTCAGSATHGVDFAKLTDLHGTRLPMRRSGPASAGRVLLIGDAAGLVDPLTGDGIFERSRVGAARE